MLEYDFHNSVTNWVRQTARVLDREMNAELAQRGISFRHAQVLSCLADEGPLSQVELAERLGIEPPSLVPVLDRMQREGVVERCACPEDRRRRLIRPLPKADACWKEILDAAHAVRGEITGGLDPDQVEQLDAILSTMRELCQRRSERRKARSA